MRFRLGDRVHEVTDRALVMGILNRTPDSFFDRGRTFDLDTAVRAALAAAAAGAGWVDIGGVPFSPDTLEVGLHEEMDRVLPVVKEGD